MKTIYLILVLVLAACGSTPDAPEPTVEPTPSGPQAGDERSDSFGIVQVWVPAGSFIRGTDDPDAYDPPIWATREKLSEQPAHPVSLSQGYWIDKFEVTNESFEAFAAAGGYENMAYWSADGLTWLAEQDVSTLPLACRDEDGPQHPRVCVTWFEAEAYANWRGGRLPTAAEWEFAARGPDSLVYPWGNEWDAIKANVLNSSGLLEVGSLAAGASWVGALDMSGNAMEWVQDWLDWNYYQLEEDLDPQGPSEGRIKLEKGGWWGSNPYVARGAYHHFEDPPDYEDHHIGFRIVSDSQ
jgi:formylglycine-generating enzyme required for sulfatase activity